jgi:hypothetical protein
MAGIESEVEEREVAGGPALGTLGSGPLSGILTDCFHVTCGSVHPMIAP